MRKPNAAPAKPTSTRRSQPYETLTETVEKEVQSDPGYLALKQAFEDSKSVAVRAEQKLELAKTDRAEKGKPYQRPIRCSRICGSASSARPEYNKGGLSRMLDGWVARLCRYDEAYLNYARLTELPDRIAEHLASMRLEEAEAQAAIERFEAQRWKSAAPTSWRRTRAGERKAEGARRCWLRSPSRSTRLREQQERAASGDSAVRRRQARLVIEEGLVEGQLPGSESARCRNDHAG
jgi:hypothetical protein